MAVVIIRDTLLCRHGHARICAGLTGKCCHSIVLQLFLLCLRYLHSFCHTCTPFHICSGSYRHGCSSQCCNCCHNCNFPFENSFSFCFFLIIRNHFPVIRFRFLLFCMNPGKCLICFLPYYFRDFNILLQCP